MSREDDKALWKQARDKQRFPSLGVAIAAGQVWKLNFIGESNEILGPVEGAYADVTDGTRVHRVGAPVAASIVAGPVALLGALSTKSKASSIVVVASSTVEKKHDGNGQVRRAQQEAARFNARAGAA